MIVMIVIVIVTMKIMLIIIIFLHIDDEDEAEDGDGDIVVMMMMTVMKIKMTKNTCMFVEQFPVSQRYEVLPIIFSFILIRFLLNQNIFAVLNIGELVSYWFCFSRNTIHLKGKSSPELP